MSVMKDGYRIILRHIEGVKILWDGVSFLELTVPPRMAGKMCGLCGNFNGNPEDDLIGKHGAMVPSGQQFGNSWRVGGKKACSVLPRDVPARQPPCKQDWQANIRSIKHCAAINTAIFSPCHSVMRPEFYFKACRIDMCECPGEQCHCEVLTAYARECERAGVRIPNWRDATGCKNIIPFKYSGENLHSGETSQPNATLNEVLDLATADLDILNMAQGRVRTTATNVAVQPKEKPSSDSVHDLFAVPRKKSQHVGGLKVPESRAGKDLGDVDGDEENDSGGEVSDNDDIGQWSPAFRQDPVTIKTVPTVREMSKKELNKARKKELRRMRRLQRKRDKERRRMEKRRKKELAKLRGSDANLGSFENSRAINLQGLNIDLNSPDLRDKLNNITLLRVKQRGENKLKWNTGSSKPPPFETLLRSSAAADENEDNDDSAASLLRRLPLSADKKINPHHALEAGSELFNLDKDSSSSDDITRTSLSQEEDYSANIDEMLDSINIDELLKSTNLDTLRSAHRKNWKRRRPTQLN